MISAHIEQPENELKEIYDYAEKKRSAKNKNFYLHHAIRRGETQWVKYLLVNGESAFTKDIDGNTPLSLAADQRYGRGYDIFMLITEYARNEIKNGEKQSDYPEIIKQCSKTFSIPLLEDLQDYSDELLSRSRLVKFFSIILGLDRTLERNQEQIKIYEAIYNAELSKDYYPLYKTLDQPWEQDPSDLHKKLEVAKNTGQRIFASEEEREKHRLALIEIKKKQPISTNVLLIRKFNDTIKENKRLAAENAVLMEVVHKQNESIQELKDQVFNLNSDMREMKQMFMTMQNQPRMIEQPKQPTEPQSLNWFGSMFATEPVQTPEKQRRKKRSNNNSPEKRIELK